MPDAPILRYYAGSDEAFEEIYSAWWPRLVRFLTSLGADWHQAEDLAQEALYRVARTCWRGARYDPSGGTFQSWILMIARNLWLDCLRKRTRHPAEEPISHPDGLERALPVETTQVAWQEANVAALENSRRLHKLLNRLPLEQREAVILHDLEGLSYREAAEVLDVPQGTVVSRRELGLTKLRASWRVREAAEGVTSDAR